MHREVNLTKRVQTPQGLRYCRLCSPPMGESSRSVLVNGKEERQPEGAYYLEWRDKASVCAFPWAKTPAMPVHAPRKEAELTRNNGVASCQRTPRTGTVDRGSGRRFPGRNEAHEEAEDPGRVHDGPELLHRILPQTLSSKTSSVRIC